MWTKFLLLIGIPTAIIVIATLAMPRKYVANHLGWLAMFVVLFFSLLSQQLAVGLGRGGVFVAAPMLVAVMAIVAAAVLKLIIIGIQIRWRDKPWFARFQLNIPLGPLDSPNIRWALALILTGILAAIVTWFTFLLLLSPSELFWLSTTTAIATAAMIWIYFGLQRWRRAANAAGTVNDAATSLSPMTTVQLIFMGILAGYIVFLIVRTLPLDTMPAWLAHAIVIAAAAALWIIAVRRPPQMKIAPASFRQSIVALLVASMAMPILVAWRADTIAGGAPYCIQVESYSRDNSPYRRPKTAETLLDLSGLTMRSRPGTFHATLTVKTWSTIWSYRKLSFVEPPVGVLLHNYCTPIQDFARRLPILFAD